MNNFVDLAKTRRSVRSYNGKKPDPILLEELMTFAESITNPYDIDVRFVFMDAEEHGISSPVLTGEKMYVSAVVKKQPHAEEAYGYSFEKLLMRAHELGLGMVWIGRTITKDKVEEASDLAPDEIMPCASPIGEPAEKMSVKEILMRKGVKADTRMKFEDLFSIEYLGNPLSERYAKEHGLFDDLEAVRFAPSAVNKQPWRVVINKNKAHFFVKHDKGFATPDYDIQKIDVGIALYHFEAQMISENRHPVLSTEKPAIHVPKDVDYVATYTF